MKKIILNIFTTKTPLAVSVFTTNGVIISNYVIEQNSTRICVCSKSPQIAISAVYGVQKQTQYLTLTNCKLQCYNLNFIFNQTRPTQNIFLFDNNYNLPVKNAVLNFSKIL